MQAQMAALGDKPIIPYRALPFVAPALALTLPSYTDN